MLHQSESLSVIIPAYREYAVVGEVVAGVAKACSSLGCDYEIIVVDDGSNDGTGEAAKRAGATVLTHPYNKGYGASLKTGIRAAQHRTVLFIDADGQHDPNDIPRLLEGRAGHDMVVGARKAGAGSPLWRRPGKLVLGMIANQLTGIKIPDLNSGFRAIDRKLALQFLPIMPDGFSFSTTSTIAAFRGGSQVHYTPIEVRMRSGKSTVTAADGFKTLMLIVRLVTLFAPLRVFLPISFATFIVGAAFTLYGYTHTGEASLKGLIALLAAVQFFLFGVMVDQVSAVRRGEIIRRP